MAENFHETTEALFKGMEEFITTKTVVGEAVHVGDTTILPLVDVSFGMISSVRNEPQKHNGGGGMGGKMSPNALLIIYRNGTTRLVNVRDQDGISKLIDMAPDLINRFKSGKQKSDPEVDKAVDEESKKTTKFDR